jgi:2-polyprenyl-3-methyl-5-hydroxy-6-metoxy-1,4-benzoquinol methylase
MPGTFPHQSTWQHREARQMNTLFVTRETCPGCDAGGGTTLLDLPFCEPPLRDYLCAFYEPQGHVEFAALAGARYVLVECGACGMIYQRHIGNDELLVQLYDRWIDPTKAFALHDGVLPPAHFIELGRQIGNVLDYFGRNPREVTCLDFGMGWGHWCRVARGFGCQVMGTELSAARVAFAQREGLCVITSEQLAQHRFDLINTEQIFEHLPNPYPTLQWLTRSLKADGLIRISVPDGADIKRRLRHGDWLAPKGSRHSLNAIAPLEHINCFNHQVICRLARRAGLHLQRIPERFATSLVDALKGLIRPTLHRLLGRGVALYFSLQPQAR